ncbi:MAG: molybdenum cofactor biosynthesis protein MoaE [Terricaulis sp.]
MRVVVCTTPLDAQAELERFADGRGGDVGALASFIGYCRGTSSHGEVTCLHLDHYPGFTEAEIARLAAATAERHKLIDLLVIHRAGAVAPRDPVVLVAALAGHRAEAFAAVSELMDYLKTDAPFWKREVSGGESRWIEPTETDRVRRAARGD